MTLVRPDRVMSIAIRQIDRGRTPRTRPPKAKPLSSRVPVRHAFNGTCWSQATRTLKAIASLPTRLGRAAFASVDVLEAGAEEIHNELVHAHNADARATFLLSTTCNWSAAKIRLWFKLDTRLFPL